MDTRDVNALGPGKFRTRSDSGRTRSNKLPESKHLKLAK